MSSTYHPQALFEGAAGNTRAMITPGRYIQGPGVLGHIGKYLKLFGAGRVALITSQGGRRRLGELLEEALTAAGIAVAVEVFNGQCSYEEADRVADRLKSGSPVEILIAVGGGKCLDIGKAIAWRVGVPMIVCPTVASTDAPTSALAVMYDEHGVNVGAEFYLESPWLVLVDTEIIALAPTRLLSAGMADSLASWYEARACYANPEARSVLGARTPFSVLAIAEAAAEILFEHGVDALESVDRGKTSAALEHVVEANTLSSGVGFESGGLAVAHAIAKGLTAVDAVRHDYLHGELVAIGILTQLALCGEDAELTRVREFFDMVGLPNSYTHLDLDVGEEADAVDKIVDLALTTAFIHHIGFQVTPAALADAIRTVG